jgi:histidinol phosphatase-like enzyme (inositol monophosphatase family)
MTTADVPVAELEDFAIELGLTAGSLAQAYFRKTYAVENKDDGGFDPVTSADRAIEAVLRKSILERFPDHGIVAEEEGDRRSRSPYTWFIDPIDGTRSFMMGSPLWGTLIGLTQRELPLFGLLSQPYLRELYLGAPSGSWLITEGRRERLQASHCTELESARLACTHPGLFDGLEAAAFEDLRSRCMLDRFGGDCYNYAMLAAGFVDLVVEGNLHSYDIVPLIPILEGAGAVVTNWQGRAPMDGGLVVAAATRELHRNALAVLESAAGPAR